MRCGSVVLTISLGLTLLGGCAGPSERFANRASALGFDASRVEGEGFTHIVFRPATPRPNGGRVLHVYLDGDGTPWEHGGPAGGPTLHAGPLDERALLGGRGGEYGGGRATVAFGHRPRGDHLARLQRRGNTRHASRFASARDRGRGHGRGQSRRGRLGGSARPLEARGLTELARRYPAPRSVSRRARTMLYVAAWSSAICS